MRDYSGQQWIILIGIGIIQFCSGLNASIEAPFYPLEAERKGCSATEYGLVLGSFNIAISIGCPLCGKLLGKIKAHTVFNWGNYIAAISTILFGFLDHIDEHYQFFGLSFLLESLQGAGYAALMISTSAILAEQFPKAKTTTFAALESIYGFGLIVGPAVGSVLYASGGFTLPFVVNGAILLITATITFFIIPKSNSDLESTERSEKGLIFKILRIKEVAIAMACMFASSLATGFVQSTLEPQLRVYKLSSIALGMVFIVRGVTYTISTPLLTWISEKITRPQLVSLFGIVALAIAFCLIGPAPFLPYSPTLGLILAGLAFNGIGHAAENVSTILVAFNACTACGFENETQVFSVVSILYITSLGVGSFVGPFVGGLLFDNVGFQNATIFVVALQLLVGLLLCVIFCCMNPTRRRRPTVALIEETPVKKDPNANVTSLRVEFYRSYGSIDQSCRAIL